MDDFAFYDIVAAELAAHDIKPGLWTKAFAEAAGDTEVAKAIYIKLRVAQLIEAAKQQERAAKEHAREERAKKRDEAIGSCLLGGFVAIGGVVLVLAMGSFIVEELNPRSSEPSSATTQSSAGTMQWRVRTFPNNPGTVRASVSAAETIVIENDIVRPELDVQCSQGNWFVFLRLHEQVTRALQISFDNRVWSDDIPTARGQDNDQEVFIFLEPTDFLAAMRPSTEMQLRFFVRNESSAETTNTTFPIHEFDLLREQMLEACSSTK